jgi:hypothetical protein
MFSSSHNGMTFIQGEIDLVQAPTLSDHVDSLYEIVHVSSVLERREDVYVLVLTSDEQSAIPKGWQGFSPVAMEGESAQNVISEPHIACLPVKSIACVYVYIYDNEKKETCRLYSHRVLNEAEVTTEHRFVDDLGNVLVTSERQEVTLQPEVRAYIEKKDDFIVTVVGVDEEQRVIMRNTL